MWRDASSAFASVLSVEDAFDHPSGPAGDAPELVAQRGFGAVEDSQQAADPGGFRTRREGIGGPAGDEVARVPGPFAEDVRLGEDVDVVGGEQARVPERAERRDRRRDPD